MHSVKANIFAEFGLVDQNYLLAEARIAWFTGVYPEAHTVGDVLEKFLPHEEWDLEILMQFKSTRGEVQQALGALTTAIEVAALITAGEL